MSYRKRPYSNSIASTDSSLTPPKRYRKNYPSNARTDKFESQDLWKNLDRIKQTRTNANKIIKNSIIFITVSNTESISDGIEFLLEYIPPKNLQYMKSNDKGASGYILLKDFSLLDCVLVLSVLFAGRDKKWVQSYNKDFTRISSDLHLSGSIFVGKNCLWSKDNLVKGSLLSSWNFTVVESKVRKLSSFREFTLKSGNGVSLTYFMNGIIDFISSMKFGKWNNGLAKQFGMVWESYKNNINFHLKEMSLIGSALFDFKLVREKNEILLRNSGQNLKNYIRDLTLNGSNSEVSNSTTISANLTPTTNKSRWNSGSPENTNSTVPNLPDQTRHSNSDIATSKPNPEAVKQYCISTVKASIDKVRKMPSDVIFKAYIKCPKQEYADKIQQNLDNIRSRTNCNVVILHISNIHESEQWLNSLKISKYTKVRDPPPVSVKVVSIGGIGEYVTNALDMINKIMNS